MHVCEPIVLLGKGEGGDFLDRWPDYEDGPGRTIHLDSVNHYQHIDRLGQ